MNRWYGYRCTEIKLPKIELMKKSAKITLHMPAWREFDEHAQKKVMRVSLGCHVLGAVNPVPDLSHPYTSLHGIQKRFLRDPPKADRKLVRKFKKFVKRWVSANLPALSPDTDFGIDKWLEDAPYPLWRKEQLKRKFDAMDNEWDKAFELVKSFIKDECYPSFKHSRGINSRTDEFKCLVGPIFKAIEKVLFDPKICPYFIKKIPVCDRPDYIIELLSRPGAFYFASDYTAFESLFTRDVMTSCEFILYDHMLRHTPEHKAFMKRCHEVLAGNNVCQYKWFTARCEATRMSGEMNTSLGNGFSNLMFMLFMCEQKGCTNVKGVIEGDDGLFTMEGTPPTQDDFAKLGLNIKLEIHEELNTASFCGLIFDLEDRKNVTNPIEAMLDFGLTTAEYNDSGDRAKLEMLKGKSISLGYSYAGCPVLSALARYGMRVTRGVRIGSYLNSQKISQWEREQLLEAIEHRFDFMTVEVKMNTRFLVEQQFGLCVEKQMEIEKYLDSLTSLQPLNIPNIDLLVHQDALVFSEKYGAKYSDAKNSVGDNVETHATPLTEYY